MLYLAISAHAQEVTDGYNPFISDNLDDTDKLTEVSVVESSYHYYSVLGDPNYNEPSVFVWYVENGTFGTYDSTDGSWTEASGTESIGDRGGVYLEITGESDDNSSGTWVRWNDDTGGSYTGYVAVYERSSDDCIYEDQITGFKHEILVPPEAWFLVGEREECADQTYAITVQFNEIHDGSYPYTLTYTYPDTDGEDLTVTDTIRSGDLDDSLQRTWDLPAVGSPDDDEDATYTITLTGLSDKYGSTGKIAPDGESGGEYASISITIHHLPQTNSMEMDP